MKNNAKNSKKLYFKSKKYYKRRALKRRLLTIVIALGVVLFFVIFFCFRLKTIQIVGNTKYEENAIVSASELKINQNLLFANTKKARKNIIEKFSYINEVKIKKKLLNKIQIEVKISEPLLEIEKDNMYILIDKNSRILEIVNNAHEITLIKGIEIGEYSQGDYIQNEKLKTAINLINLCNINEIFGINDVDFGIDNEIILNYNNNVKIIFGSTIGVENKIETLKEITKNGKFDSDKPGLLDLRGLEIGNKVVYSADYEQIAQKDR